MMKRDVIHDIDRLCVDIDDMIYGFVNARVNHSEHELYIAECKMEQLIVAAYQELAFLRDYINENVKDHE